MTNIPHWARWIAMDSDGSYWCYEAEPHMHDKGWYENEVGRCLKLKQVQSPVQKWKLSLTKIKQ